MAPHDFKVLTQYYVMSQWFQNVKRNDTTRPWIDKSASTTPIQVTGERLVETSLKFCGDGDGSNLENFPMDSDIHVATVPVSIKP